MAPHRLVLLGALLACGKPSDPGEGPASVPPESTANREPPASAVVDAAEAPKALPQAITCKSLPFAQSLKLPEASGALALEDGTLLVIGDSDTGGIFARVSAETGELIGRGNLPLDKRSSDDLEGLSWRDGHLVAITSSGWIREWKASGDDFVLAHKSYPLARYDERELVCKDSRASNCAQNYEGLCLHDAEAPEGACVGFAAAKATGLLRCLVLEKGRLRLDPDRSIKVAGAKTLSGCHFDKRARLWYGNNLFGANRIGFVENWREPKDAVITRIGGVGLGFGEAIAVGAEDELFRFSDTAGSPSLQSKHLCR